MPPFFAYIMVLMAYIAVACAVWFLAVVLAFPRRTRGFAKRIAAGMAGSFPGVFLFQLISAPLAVFSLLLFGGVFWAFQPTGGWRTFCFISVFFGTVGLVAIASLLGFFTGWRVAWELAAGRSARAFLVTDRVLGPVVRFLRKRLPFLERVL